MTHIVAHRGLSSKAPENTYHSFDLAFSKGINHVEFDVQLTKDNKVVIIHDETIDRTSNGFGKVREKNLDELLRLDFGSWFSSNYENSKIPELYKVLDRYKNVNFVIEIKGKDIELVPKVLDLISNNKYWRDEIFKSNVKTPKIIFCSFLPQQIEILRKFSNDIVIGFLVKEMNDRVIKFAKEQNLDGIFPYYKLLNEKVVENLKKRNFIISSWGFESIKDVNKIANLNIDGITVDWPDEI